MKEDPKGRHYKKENQWETDATTVVALIVMLRNVVYLLSQRSAIAVRASRAWWRTALTELGAAARPFSGKTGSRAPAVHFNVPSRGGGRARLSVTTVSSGGEVRGLRVARHVTSGSFLHKVICSTRRSKQNGAFRAKKEKDITLFLNVSFSRPGWEVYLMQVQGNSIAQTAADLGFLTPVEEV